MVDFCTSFRPFNIIYASLLFTIVRWHNALIKVIKGNEWLSVALKAKQPICAMLDYSCTERVNLQISLVYNSFIQTSHLQNVSVLILLHPNASNVDVLNTRLHSNTLCVELSVKLMSVLTCLIV